MHLQAAATAISMPMLSSRATWLGDPLRLRARLAPCRLNANTPSLQRVPRLAAEPNKPTGSSFGPWSTKAGILHVEPPFALIERMITLRAHLEDCGEDNAPLLVVPGSHRLGRLPANEVASLAERIGLRVRLAKAGDVWLNATAIVHASKASVRPTRRRVLQIDFSADRLPGAIEWLGV
jgi:hypothetical protein